MILEIKFSCRWKMDSDNTNGSCPCFIAIVWTSKTSEHRCFAEKNCFRFSTGQKSWRSGLMNLTLPSWRRKSFAFWSLAFRMQSEVISSDGNLSTEQWTSALTNGPQQELLVVPTVDCTNSNGLDTWGIPKNLLKIVQNQEWFFFFFSEPKPFFFLDPFVTGVPKIPSSRRSEPMASLAPPRWCCRRRRRGEGLGHPAGAGRGAVLGNRDAAESHGRRGCGDMVGFKRT